MKSIKTIIYVFIFLFIILIGWFLYSGKAHDEYANSNGQDIDKMLMLASENTQNEVVVQQLKEDKYSLKMKYSGPKTYLSKYGELPNSLRGTKIPILLNVDSEGHLIINRSVKEVIEYFLSAIGEEPVETIIDRLVEFFSKELDEPARSEALNVLSDYIAYKESLADIELNLSENARLSGNALDYQEIFKARKDARLNAFTPSVYEAFFSGQDKLDTYTIKLLEIKNNKQLSDQEVQAQIHLIEEQLPILEKETLIKERNRNILNKRIEEAKASNASEAEIFQIRTEFYDAETAARFAEADKKKEHWELRIQHYKKDKEKILANDDIPVKDKENSILKIQQEQFSEKEQIRIRTLDKIGDQ